ncbi:MAG: S24/S26 family peptidase [Bacteroidaceae bacterium]
MIVKELPNDQFMPHIRELISNGHTVSLRLKGNSMRPFLESLRDKALLAPCTQPQKGDAILAQIKDGRYVLHRIVKIEGNNITLMGDGNVGFTEHCQRADVLGIATHFYRKGRMKPDATNGWKWKFYSFIWTHLSGLRRYLLAFYRRIWLNLFPIKINNTQTEYEN